MCLPKRHLFLDLLPERHPSSSVLLLVLDSRFRNYPLSRSLSTPLRSMRWHCMHLQFLSRIKTLHFNIPLNIYTPTYNNQILIPIFPLLRSWIGPTSQSAGPVRSYQHGALDLRKDIPLPHRIPLQIDSGIFRLRRHTVHLQADRVRLCVLLMDYLSLMYPP